MDVLFEATSMASRHAIRTTNQLPSPWSKSTAGVEGYVIARLAGAASTGFGLVYRDARVWRSLGEDSVDLENSDRCNCMPDELGSRAVQNYPSWRWLGLVHIPG